MKLNKEKIKELVKLKFKFGISSTIATLVNISLFLFLEPRMSSRAVANFIAYFTGVAVNFTLQKKFVFESNGNNASIFAKAMLVSLGGWALDTAIIYGLSTMTFFDEHQQVTKIISTGIVFFYNFYFKRYAFEKKFI